MVGGKLSKCCPCRQGRGKDQEENIKIAGTENHETQEPGNKTEDGTEKKSTEVERGDPPLLISLQTQLHDIEEIEEEQNGDDTSSSSTLFSKNSSIRKDHRGSEDSRQFQSSPSPTFSISNIHLIKGRRKKKIRFVKALQGSDCFFLREARRLRIFISALEVTSFLFPFFFCSNTIFYVPFSIFLLFFILPHPHFFNPAPYFLVCMPLLQFSLFL